MADLLWGENRRKMKGPKPTLDLGRIVTEAMAIADAEGIAALSMNSLARRLGVGTMSLYRYIPGKDQLVALMIDAAIGEPPPDDSTSGQSWRQALRRFAALTLEVFDRHPWLLPLIATPRRLGPHELAWGESALKAIADAGTGAQDSYHIVMLLNSFVRGFAQMSAQPGHGPGLDLEAMSRSGNLDRYGMLISAMEVSGGEHGWTGRPDLMFDFGLERLLDGVELYLKSRN